MLPTKEDMVDAVITAAAPITRHFRNPIRITLKPDGTSVSSVDQQVNDRLLHWTKRFNSVGFIGEEGNDYHNEDYILCADPLDGSDAYAGGNSNVAVSLALLRHFAGEWWEPEIAVVYDPIHLTCWVSQRTKPTTRFTVKDNSCSRLKIKCEAANHVPRRVTISTWPGVPFQLDAVQRAVMTRRDMYLQQEFGCILIPGALVASGLWQATVFAGNGATESIATSLLVTQAGGVAVDCNGEPLSRFKLGERHGKLDFLLENGAIMAADQETADDLVAIIRSKQP